MTRTDGVIFAVVFAMITLDFISGTIAALANGDWKSKVMRTGLLHKCSLLLCVALGGVLNFGQVYLDMGINIPVYESICGYISLMEAGSIIENVCKCNPELMPDKLRGVFGLPDKDEKGDKHEDE